MTRRARLLFAAALLSGLIGCGRRVRPVVPSDGPQATVSEEVDVSISFYVEGGYANLRRTLHLDSEDRVEYEVGGAWSVGEARPGRFLEISALLDASNLFDEDRTFDVKRGADLQRYEIRYQGHTVVAYDTSLPDALTEAVQRLESVFADRPKR